MFDQFNTGLGVTALQRSAGTVKVALTRDGLSDLYQSGSAKAILMHGRLGPEVTFLNTSGGLTSGDRYDCAMSLGPGVRALASTQTAERAYRAKDGCATLTVAHTVGAGAWLDWLPQETILYNDASIRRDCTIDLAAGAGCLTLDTLVFGRAAMGETVSRLALFDRRTIRRDGRLITVEHLAFGDDALSSRGAAMFAGARAISTLILIGPSDRLPAIRAALDEPGVRSGASVVGERLVVRMAAPDHWPLRRQIIRLLGVLRPGPLPRVWQM